MPRSTDGNLPRPAAIVAAGFLATSGIFWVAIEWNRMPRAPLVAGLNDAMPTPNEAFDGRVKASFPVGSPVKAMVAEFTRQGFAPTPLIAWTGREYQTEWSGISALCRQIVRVFWQVDSDSRLTAIRGEYKKHCLTDMF